MWNLSDLISASEVIVTLIGIIVAGFIAIIVAYIPIWHGWRDEQLLKKSFGSELFTPEVIKRSTRYYVHPDCSNVDPSREAEIRNVVATKEKLFSFIDQFLASDSIYRHMIILADSGMGKTSALLNYYAINQRRRSSKRYQIALIPLGIPDVDERIAKVEGKPNTVIFLDAFDEDTSAIVDHAERLRDLMAICIDFKRVIITCRTQFFHRDVEIPDETGIIRVGPRKVGEKGIYTFQKLYLMPLGDHQVAQYLRKRYPVWRWWQRSKAKKIVAQIPDLSARPMLLSYIPDLITTQQTISYAYELYENLIDAWLLRESLFVEPKSLRRFSELLAVDLYINRKRRGAERIPRVELRPLANKWSIPLDDWQLAGRSLLNRDAEGNFKFAHRSIMEYLFLRCDVSSLEVEWKDVLPTDQMELFIKEIIASHTFFLLKNLPQANLAGANLVGANLTGANLVEANLVGANLREANLVGANLRGANLTEADLRRARYDYTTIWPDGLDYRNCGACGPQANLEGANLEGANLAEANLEEANLTGAYLERANLTGANLTGAKLVFVNLKRANLERANLAGANLTGARLEGANLAGTNLKRTNLAGAWYSTRTTWPVGFAPLDHRARFTGE